MDKVINQITDEILADIEMLESFLKSFVSAFSDTDDDSDFVLSETSKVLGG